MECYDYKKPMVTTKKIPKQVTQRKKGLKNINTKIYQKKKTSRKEKNW